VQSVAKKREYYIVKVYNTMSANPTGQKLKMLYFQDRDQNTVQILFVIFSMPSGMSLFRTSKVAVLKTLCDSDTNPELF